MDGDVGLTEKRFNELVEDYFSGLTKSVGKNNGIDTKRITKSTASFTPKQKSTNWQSFEGKVGLYDVFFTQNQIKLNVKVKGKYCLQIDKHLIIFSFSPKSFEHDVWKMFDNIRTIENCSTLKNVISFKTKKTEHYELIIPSGKQNGILILFPGFPENPKIIKSEFKITEPAVRKGISIALMEFNQRIWLEDNEKTKLSVKIHTVFFCYGKYPNRYFFCHH